MNIADVYDFIADEWKQEILQLDFSAGSRASYLIAIAAARVCEELEKEKTLEKSKYGRVLDLPFTFATEKVE